MIGFSVGTSTQIGQLRSSLTAFPMESQANIGSSVAISDDNQVIAAGAPASNSAQGKVQVYVRGNPQSDGWNNASQQILTESLTQRFGDSLAISSNGNFLFVGAPGSGQLGGSAGLVYVYTKDIFGSYSRIQTITASPAIAFNTAFGKSIACSRDGTKLVIDTAFSTIKRVYTWNGSSFVLQQEISLPSSFNNINTVGLTTGLTMNSTGTRFAVGLPVPSQNRGYVFVYDFNGISWNLLQQITGPQERYLFGRSCDFNETGDILAVSAINLFGDGAVITYREQAGWSSSIIESSVRFNFGIIVKLNSTGSALIAGANDIVYLYNKSDPQSAAQYQFVQSFLGNNTVDNIGSPSGADRFGWSIDITPNASTIIVGAPLHDYFNDFNQVTYQNQGAFYLFGET